MYKILKYIFVFFLSIHLSYQDEYSKRVNVTSYLSKISGNSDYQSFVGFLPVNSNINGSNIFYQFVSASKSDINDPIPPLIVWLQGGPGCSSMFGMYTEIGPFNVEFTDANKNDSTLKYNKYTYATDNHLLFVDQPIGVGFSNIRNGTAPRYAEEAAEHFENFMVEFFKVYPNLKQNSLYIFGESYAGHYIPSFTARLIKNNGKNQFNLAGIAIGDGWTEPERQANTYDSYAYSIGIISKMRKEDYKKQQAILVRDIENGNYASASGLFDYITGGGANFTNSIGNLSDNVNIYNYKQYSSSMATPTQTDPLTIFLNKNETKINFNISSDFVYNECNDTMYLDFYDDISRSYKENITYILQSTKVLLYNGQNDIIVNTPGAENWISSMDWDKAETFLMTPKKFWRVNGVTVGTVKNVDNLTFVYVKKAGHMVPTDQPENTKDMINRWMNNKWN